MALHCANCRSEGRPAFTLAAYPSDGDDAVLVDFCSSDCLAAWTTDGDASGSEWSFGDADVREPASRAH